MWNRWIRKSMPACSTGFPEDYIESVSQRLTLYRRLSRLTTLSEISDIKKELKDRYGRLPRSCGKTCC